METNTLEYRAFEALRSSFPGLLYPRWRVFEYEFEKGELGYDFKYELAGGRNMGKSGNIVEWEY